MPEPLRQCLPLVGQVQSLQSGSRAQLESQSSLLVQQERLLDGRCQIHQAPMALKDGDIRLIDREMAVAGLRAAPADRQPRTMLPCERLYLALGAESNATDHLDVLPS